MTETTQSTSSIEAPPAPFPRWQPLNGHTLIPACDVSIEQYEKLVKATHDLPMVSAYKIGFVLGLSAGLPRVVEITRKYTNKPLIYDHQKAGTDIPDTGRAFMQTLQESGVQCVILFPQAGPKTQQAWIEAAQETRLGVMVGGWMTHAGYTQKDGGYLTEEGILSIYQNAARWGVSEYVVPGNQPDVIQRIRNLLVAEGVQPTFYSPGFLTQGGVLEDAAEAAGPNWHAIVGRRIYQADDPRQSILDFWPFSQSEE